MYDTYAEFLQNMSSLVRRAPSRDPINLEKEKEDLKQTT